MFAVKRQDRLLLSDCPTGLKVQERTGDGGWTGGSRAADAPELTGTSGVIFNNAASVRMAVKHTTGSPLMTDGHQAFTTTILVSFFFKKKYKLSPELYKPKTVS